MFIIIAFYQGNTTWSHLGVYSTSVSSRIFSSDALSLQHLVSELPIFSEFGRENPILYNNRQTNQFEKQKY